MIKFIRPHKLFVPGDIRSFDPGIEQTLIDLQKAERFEPRRVTVSISEVIQQAREAAAGIVQGVIATITGQPLPVPMNVSGALPPDEIKDKPADAKSTKPAKNKAIKNAARNK